jgi:hypothetical protein
MGRQIEIGANRNIDTVTDRQIRERQKIVENLSTMS